MTWTTVNLKDNNDRILKAVPSHNQLQLLRYVYVSSINKFVNMEEINLQLKPIEFDEMYQDYVPKRPKDKEHIPPSKIIREINKDTNVVFTMDMYPDLSSTIVEIGHGLKAFNLCATKRKFSFDRELKHPTLFLEHVSFLLDGDKASIDYVLKWITHLVFKPAKKMQHGLMLSGGQGTGKSTFTDVVGCLVGQNNYITLSPDDIKDTFNNWLIGNRLAVVEEIKENGNHDLYNKIKPLFTSPRINMNVKMESKRQMQNHLHFIFLSNASIPLPFSDDDRRLFFFRSKQKKRNQEYYSNLNKYLRNEDDTFREEAINEIAFYLKNKILPTIEDDFAHREPHVTEDKVSLAEASQHPIKQWILEGLANKEGIFADDVWFEWNTLLLHIPQEYEFLKKNRTALHSEFLSCGLIRLTAGNRPRIKNKRLDVCFFEKSKDNIDFKDTTREGREKLYSQQYSFMPDINPDIGGQEAWTTNMDNEQF